MATIKVKRVGCRNEVIGLKKLIKKINVKVDDEFTFSAKAFQGNGKNIKNLPESEIEIKVGDNILFSGSPQEFIGIFNYINSIDIFD